MPVYRLDERILFPPPELAEEGGLLAVGGDLCPERLLLAYSQGIFPWYGEGLPILWHSPDPRMVLVPDALHVPRSLRKQIRRGIYDIRFDTAFDEVIAGCRGTPRPGQDSTWITDEIAVAYTELHRLGFAHSAEAWRDGVLAGGLYGVSLGRAFFGESMFAHAPDASKAAFVVLVEALAKWRFELIDCQVYTDHLARFGAEMWPRHRFLAALAGALHEPGRRGRWSVPQNRADTPAP